jgi:hypothetical protein
MGSIVKGERRYVDVTGEMIVNSENWNKVFGLVKSGGMWWNE